MTKYQLLKTIDYGLWTKEDFLTSGMYGRATHDFVSLILFILFIFFIGSSAVAQKEKRDNYPWISIGDIKACKSDTFRIQAKVINRYHCPPCPEGAICKPCIGDHVIVVDTDGSSKRQELIFTKNPDGFAQEAVFVFTLTLHNKTHPDGGTNLIAFETLKK